MKPSDVEEKLAAMRARIEEVKKTAQPELLKFLVALGTEGERSAVVLGAERINVGLETLLKKFLRPCPNEKDPLFSSDAALGSFSRRIELAYRLGLIDSKFKQSLDAIRRLRNDFAHAITVESLQDQRHADRVNAVWELMMKGSENALEGFATAFKEAAKEVGEKIGEQTAKYLSCVMQLLVKLELVCCQMERPSILLPAKLDYKGDDPD
jgi:hypothetical protein